MAGEILTVPDAAQLETFDMQGLLLSGYAQQRFAAYLFLSVAHNAHAGEWLTALAARVTGGANFSRDRPTSINVAITYKGLQSLGLGPATLSTFSPAFAEGMSNPGRAQLLGDDPGTWDWGKPDHGIHVLLMLFARDRAGLDALLSRERAAAQGVFEELFAIESQTFPLREGSSMNQEHFGFADGIGQPSIAAYRPEKHPGNGPGNEVKAGEFILGYENEFPGQFTASPHVRNPDNDPDSILPGGDIGRNGSYLVVRQMEQDVAGFWNMVQARSGNSDGKPDVAAAELFAAKIVGRWRDGTPVTLSPWSGGGSPESHNDFGFADDSNGYHCPIGAHMRRANPRDTLFSDSNQSMTTVRRHRMIRRGRPYGPRIGDRYTPDGKPRGLVFVALNANIERQFEFIQSAWIASPNLNGFYDEADPLLGGRAKTPGRFTIPGLPVRQLCTGVLPYVKVRGGAYFFVPGLSALRWLGAWTSGGRVVSS